MRLRYLHLENEAQLENITIPFGQDTVLGRNCAIRFIVGVNGSGKSRLLRALNQVFLALEQGQTLPFPVTLVYDLAWHPELKQERARTIFFHYAGRGSEMVWRAHELAPQPISTFDDWDNYLQGYPEISTTEYSDQIAFFLPQSILAYTSGLVRDWETLFAPAHSIFEVENEDLADERPSEWNVQKQISHLQTTDPDQAKRLMDAQEKLDPERYSLISSETQAGFFVSSPTLRLAVCAISLYQALKDFRDTPTETDEQVFKQRVQEALASQKPQTGLRGLLDEIGWLWPVTLTLKFDPSEVELGRLRLWESITERLQNMSTVRIKAPEPGQTQSLIFDLRSPLSERISRDTSTLAELFDAFRPENSSEAVTAFTIFRLLYQWQRAGYLQELTMTLHKEGIEDLMLYDWLSDGEQLFLGRMALFHLLQDEQDALIILDEPETHFNDVWKRRIVDIIDDSLRDQHHEVIISTHSSIALTDVFDTEITLLKNGDRSPIAIPTFGASPSQLMIYIFDAPDSMGQRAMEFLDDRLEKDWQPEDIPELDRLIENLAPGYHRAELQAIRRGINAPQN